MYDVRIAIPRKNLMFYKIEGALTKIRYNNFLKTDTAGIEPTPIRGDVRFQRYNLATLSIYKGFHKVIFYKVVSRDLRNNFVEHRF